MLLDPGVCCLKFRDLVFEVLEGTFDIGGGENLEGISEVVGQTVVINDVPTELIGGGPIHPCNRLQQGVVGQFAV